MAVSTRLIRRRIKSVTSTKKITKAMELVAASKMRKAVSGVLATRPYAEAAWRAISEIAKVTDPGLHPLLSTKPGADRILVILVTSDRGLCGGFNAQMTRKVNAFLDGVAEGVAVDFVTVGKKGQAAVRRFGRDLVASFVEMEAHPVVTDVRPIAEIATGDFIAGKYGAVYLAFTDYVSALVQKPNISQLLPITRIKGLGDVTELESGKASFDTTQDRGKREDHSSAEDLKTGTGANEYLFEPSPEAVLREMLPRLVEAQVYQAILESSASEHSARMVAMRSATDAATEMIDSLTLTYNRVRQAGITAEIAEISSGKAALESNR